MISKKTVLGIAFASVFVAIATLPTPAFDAAPMAGSAVRLQGEGMIGSGVHIGNGFILTAAHVVGAEKSVEVVTDIETSTDGSIMWASPKYDVALVRVKDFANIGAASLDCRNAAVGENVRTIGNPLGEKFVSSWGRIASSFRRTKAGKEIIVSDLTAMPGNSGGPVYGERGSVVGILVMVMTAPAGLTARSVTGMSSLVPSSTICALLAR